MFMWRLRTEDEKHADEKNRWLRHIGLTVLVWAVLLCVVAAFQVWHGRSMGGLVLLAPRLVPGVWLNAALVAVALGVVCRASRSRANQRNATVICQRCNRIKTNDGQTQCRCGGTFVALPKMKWVNDTVHSEFQPSLPEGADPRKPLHSLAAAR